MRRSRVRLLPPAPVYTRLCRLAVANHKVLTRFYVTIHVTRVPKRETLPRSIAAELVFRMFDDPYNYIFRVRRDPYQTNEGFWSRVKHSIMGVVSQGQF
jgi:hypothetical protein